MSFTDQRYIPTVFTRPLDDRLEEHSDGTWLIQFCDRYVQFFDGNPFHLEDWQRDLLMHVLERYPADWPVVKLRGRLRYRQVVVSMARQNGKSAIASAMALYGLFKQIAGPQVIGLASNRIQATIVFDRVKKIIDSHPELAKRFKTTHTRGITRTDRPGKYDVLPAKADSLQGIPTTLCLFDEVHLCPEDMWDAMVDGTAAKADAMVFGITTAGNDSSALLKRLYDQGQEATGAPDSRFGFFLWQAPRDCRLDDVEALLDANPSMVSGHLDVDVILEDIRKTPEDHARRYRFNQMQEGSGFWLPMPLWERNYGALIKPGEERTITFGVDRSESWEFVTITASIKDADGIVHTKPIASMRKVNIEWLTNVCVALYERHWPKGFVMEDGFILGDLVTELKNRGIPCTGLKPGDRGTAAETFYALVSTGRIRHDGNQLVKDQLRAAVKKDTDSGWVIHRKSSKVPIDAVLATVWGTYAVEKDLGFVSHIAA